LVLPSKGTVQGVRRHGGLFSRWRARHG
jgi:hypothetical protein